MTVKYWHGELGEANLWSDTNMWGLATYPSAGGAGVPGVADDVGCQITFYLIP